MKLRLIEPESAVFLLQDQEEGRKEEGTPAPSNTWSETNNPNRLYRGNIDLSKRIHHISS